MNKIETAVEIAIFLLALILVANGIRAGHILFAIFVVIMGYYAISIGMWLFKRR